MTHANVSLYTHLGFDLMETGDPRQPETMVAAKRHGLIQGTL